MKLFLTSNCRNLIIINKIYLQLFLFNNNLVSGYDYHNNVSSSKILLNLVLSLIKFQMDGDFNLYLIHVSEDRMIDCGVDVLSRGYSTKELMRREPILTFIPLHFSAEKQSEDVIPWIRSCWSSEETFPHTA